MLEYKTRLSGKQNNTLEIGKTPHSNFIFVSITSYSFLHTHHNNRICSSVNTYLHILTIITLMVRYIVLILKENECEVDKLVSFFSIVITYAFFNFDWRWRRSPLRQEFIQMNKIWLRGKIILFWETGNAKSTFVTPVVAQNAVNWTHECVVCSRLTVGDILSLYLRLSDVQYENFSHIFQAIN